MSTNDTSLVKSESTAMEHVEAANLLNAIITLAKDPTFDVEKLEKMMLMQERLELRQAERSFHAAMARLQEKLPQVAKYGHGKNSKFAKLEDIDIVTRPLLAEEGFSFAFDEESHTEKSITFLAKLSHKDGHSEVKRLTVPIDVASQNSMGKSIRPAIQDAGSTVSYARRYLIKMHLNLIERDEDTDGESTKPITPDQVKDIETMLMETKSDKAAFLRMIAGTPSIEAILARDYKRVMTSLEEKKRYQDQKATKS